MIGLGAVIGFTVGVSRDFLNIKNKTSQDSKIKKQQKLEELLNLLEITKKDSLISMSLKLAEDSKEEKKILESILKNQFDNPETIKSNESNYARIKTIASLYLNKYEQHVDCHIALIKGLELYRQIVLENAINVAKLMHEFRNEQLLRGKGAEKVKNLNQKFEEDRRKEAGLEKEVDISLKKLKDVIIQELNY